jgi:gamma-glutamyltranspeptidase/glutathione hydrolase
MPPMPAKNKCLAQSNKSWTRAKATKQRNSAADATGMMVSYIQSNYQGLGSGIVVDGISMQNRGYSFVLRPGHANVVAPRKRPFHAIIPAFVTQNGRPVMSFGVMGGSIQPQAHTQVMVRLTDYHQNPQAASDAPRWRLDDQMNVQLEHDVPAAVIDELKSRGHRTIRSDRLSPSSGGASLSSSSTTVTSLLLKNVPTAKPSASDGCTFGHCVHSN